MSNTFILLSAGCGRRMKNYGSKSLLRYRNVSVLDYQISNILKFDENAEIITVIGFESEKIRRSGPDCKLIVNQDYITTSSVYSLNLALHQDIDNLYIIHGDIIFSKTIFEVPDVNKSYVFYTSKDVFKKDKIGLIHNNSDLINLEYGCKPKWSQIAYISNNDISSLVVRDKDLLHNMINLSNDKIKFQIHENKKASVFEIDSYKDVK